MTRSRTSSSEPNDRGSVLVIGNFDGVHRGHRALVAEALGLADQHGLRSVVMTFDPHPAVVLGGEAPPVLTRLDRKVELLRAIAPNLEVVVERFDREFAALSPREFVERVLVDGHRAERLVVGANFRFGRGRVGTVALLQELGAEFGFVARAVDLAGDAQATYSSSRIRSLLVEGDIRQANELLGRPHAITGTVVHGDARGRTIGIPTANLDEVEELKPQVGIYAARVELLEHGVATELGAAVVHVGPRPTVARGETIEVHVLDRTVELYGKCMRVAFLEKLRAIEHFTDLASLKRQIELDILATRRLTG
jgi:riboflavin kinase/FMN adenylyltransferase